MRALLFLLVLALPVAAAQTVTPTITVTPDASAVTVTAGQTGLATASVNLFADGFGCGQMFTLAVDMTAAASGVHVVLAPNPAEFGVPQGVYESDPSGAGIPVMPYNETVPVAVEFHTTAGRTSQATVDVTIMAGFAGADATGSCLPATFAAAQGQASVRLTILPDQQPTPPSPPPGSGGNQTGGNGTTPPPGGDGSMEDDGNGIPAPALLAPLALAVAALRRRRQ